MAEIHIYKPGGEPIVHSEEQVIELLKSDEVLPGTLYWREGMADWQPLLTLHPASLDPVAAKKPTGILPDPSDRPKDHPASAALPEKEARFTAAHATGRRRFSFRKKPQPLTTILQVLLVTSLCVALLELTNGLVHYNTISNQPVITLNPEASALPGASADQPTAAPGSLDSMAPPNPDATPAPAAPNEEDDLGNLLEYTGWVVNGLLAVIYFIWLYRTNQNCRNFSFILRFKPEWAVACHFVPAINFFRPCQVMQEIWRVSKNPRTWNNDPFSILVGVWWALTLATLALSGYSYLQSSGAQTQADQVRAEQIFLALKVIQIAWCSVFVALVTRIVQNQVSAVRKSRHKAGHEDAE